MTHKPMVSVVFATRNRKEDLLRSLESVFAQTYDSLEVLIYDDASSDGTEDSLRNAFPSVKYHKENKCCGQAGLRNRGFIESIGDFIITLDDDAYLTDQKSIESLVEQFSKDDSIGAIAMPFFEFGRVSSKTMLQTNTSSSPGDELQSFTGCAVAFRRSSVLDSGGYRDFFVQHVEEKDLAIRLWGKEHRIVYGETSPVVHIVNPVRNREKVNYYGIRNTLLLDSLNIPHPYVVPRFLIDCIQLFVHKLTFSNFPIKFWYILCGLFACIKYIGKRKPIKRTIYRHFRSLPRHTTERRDGSIPPPLTR